jgi:uncharacterized protein (DUF927 family)
MVINCGGACRAFPPPLGMQSFGINWFGDTSDGKTLCLFAAASVAGLVGHDGLPCRADSESGIEASREVTAIC